ELAKIPLLLNIMVTVYQGENIYNEEQLFAAYIDECLERVPTNLEKREKLFYSARQTRHWLTFLARQLEAENTTEFLIENIQPTWLENTVQKWLYILIYGVIYGIIFWLIFWLIVGLVSGIIFGIIFGVTVGVICGLISGVPLSFLYVLVYGMDRKIEPLQALDFSWKNITDWMIYKLIFCIIFWLILGWFTKTIYILISGLSYLSIYLLITNLKTDIKSKNTPNQGIKESLKKSIFISIFAFPFCILTPYLYTLATDEQSGQNQFIFSLMLALIVGLQTGGEPCIQHFSLRMTLWKNGLIPWNYKKFLKYAAQRRLIQQVGGRFRFIHDSLRKHFVSYNG
ncbi:MAG: hypothetical protein F6K48_35840, partial [Okeania sp. SIO3H1]|nr:hypothetical protein [Okeania sp. SIO3H1]